VTAILWRELVKDVLPHPKTVLPHLHLTVRDGSPGDPCGLKPIHYSGCIAEKEKRAGSGSNKIMEQKVGDFIP